MSIFSWTAASPSERLHNNGLTKRWQSTLDCRITETNAIVFISHTIASRHTIHSIKPMQSHLAVQPFVRWRHCSQLQNGGYPSDVAQYILALVKSNFLQLSMPVVSLLRFISMASSWIKSRQPQKFLANLIFSCLELWGHFRSVTGLLCDVVAVAIKT